MYTASTSQTATCIIYCKVQQPPCDGSTEEVCSFGKRVSAASFFSFKEFLDARCEVKPEGHLQVMCAGGQRVGQYITMTQGKCLLAYISGAVVRRFLTHVQEMSKKCSKQHPDCARSSDSSHQKTFR